MERKEKKKYPHMFSYTAMVHGFFFLILFSSRDNIYMFISDVVTYIVALLFLQ